ncbi:MAG TPA: hypothetical protein VH440_06155 [Candidatus Limnocylindrales bacterium]|jgi:hypothetical protein
MQPAPDRSPAERDRAVDRVRRLTIGSTIAGMVGLGAFGGLAALSDSGMSTDGVTTAAISDASSGGAATTAPAPTASTDQSATTDDSATSGSAATTDDSSSAVTQSSGTAHATSGGS